MCGIVCVVRRPSTRACPAVTELLGQLEQAVAAGQRDGDLVARLRDAGAEVATVDQLLRGVPGVQVLLDHPELPAQLLTHLDALDALVASVEAELESGALVDADDVDRLELVNAALIGLRDGCWAIRKDRLRTADAVEALAGRHAGRAAVEAFTSVQLALSAIDRLEVRGRDSAGLHLLVRDHGLDLETAAIKEMLDRRASDRLFTSEAVRTADGMLSFVYKAAAEIGELGDNVKAIRAAITADRLLHLALASPTAHCTVLGHTRWASVGIISEPNAHPLNHEEEHGANAAGPYVAAALNGDVDNHADLRAADGLRIADEITTDAKVIPALVSRRVAAGDDVVEAFRTTVARFEGSVAIAASSTVAPDAVLLAQRGSGQALYVGLAEDAFIVASEPYGLVEETPHYVRLDGETPARPDEPASRGQVFVVDGARAGTLEGLRRLAYDGTELPMAETEIVRAEITTRDIDRGAFPHFLLKEISEAPTSFRKTLRGHIRERDGLLHAELGERALPKAIVGALAAGQLDRVVVIGQGTAAVAGRSLANLLGHLCGSSLRADAITATEFSGFGLQPDLSRTLVVAVSQSGTTTDTNRTVDLARARGAKVLAIVNRRNTDLTDKADGVLYTSDGRDVEMSVASTKAFYAQVAAGALLACAISEATGGGDARQRHEVLGQLRALPAAMEAVLARRDRIAEAAHRFAPPRRYWAVVGNGPNSVAAAEVRIKLSELCYKSIACDVTEDKKHIDLSCEPMILVCAAGLSGSTADDVAKEVAIYRAHKAAPIVVASEGDERFNAALAVITVPEVEAQLAFVLSAMVGHLFGYESALAIDALALPLREGRAAIEDALAGSPTGDLLLARLEGPLATVAHRFSDGLRSGTYDGALEASTAVRVSSLLRYASGMVPLDLYQLEHGKLGTPQVIVDDLTAALTRGIEELTRPIDAIKHQAKTVTVGISRSDEGLLTAPLVQAVLDAGAPRDRLSYRILKTLAELSPAVDVVNGFTRYEIEGEPTDGNATIRVVDRGGIGASITSRTDRHPLLLGTKRRVAEEREVMAARGRNDGRSLVIVPEVKGGQATGITLLHVRFVDRLPESTARAVLAGYRDRYGALRDSVTETEPAFRDDLLETVPMVELLTGPIQLLADRWRSS